MRGGVLLFANFLLASVGFSAWAIEPRIKAEINAYADDVNGFIGIDNETSNKFFKIGADGFIQDGMFCDKAVIAYNLLVFSDRYASYGISTGKAFIRFTLEERNSTQYLINTDFLSSTYFYDTQYQKTFSNSGQADISNGICTGSFELSGISKTENYPFSIKFEFNKGSDSKYVSLLNSLDDSAKFDFKLCVWGEAI